MTNSSRSLLVAITMLGAGAGIAHADARQDLEYAAQGFITGPSTTTQSYELEGTTRKPAECFAALAKAKKAGVKDGEILKGFYGSEKASSGDYTITVADVQWTCEEYERDYRRQLAAALVWDSDYFMQNSAAKMDANKSYPAEGKAAIELGQKCAAAVDAALELGLTDGTHYELTVAFADARATYCTPVEEFGVKISGAIDVARKAEHDRIEAIYKKAKVKGKKLALFVDYGEPDRGGWLAPGCDSKVTDVKKLAKAKKLFHWFEGADGYTVRKYTFKGNNYSVSERTYSTQEGAYSGCK